MVLPALEVMTEGLMSDTAMYEAFLAQREAQQGQATKRGESK
jgi:hypothetical protein